MFYPENLTDLGAPGIWRDLRIVKPSLYPIRFNPAQQKLEVAYRIVFELVYSVGSNNNVKKDPDYAIEKKYANLYNENIVNYGFLDLEETSWALDDLDYLIVTHLDVANAAGDLRTWLESKGYSTSLVTTFQLGDEWEDIYDYLKKLYEGQNKKMDYLLLLGNDDLVPMAKAYVAGEGYPTYTDYKYSLLAGDDPWPDVAVTRLSGNDVEGLAHQIEKIIDYNKGVEPSAWPRNNLLVAHKEEGLKSKFCKERIRMTDWPYFNPVFVTCYGDEGSTNEDVSTAINNGAGIVNYSGHGRYDRWRDWNEFGEDWIINDV